MIQTNTIKYGALEEERLGNTDFIPVEIVEFSNCNLDNPDAKCVVPWLVIYYTKPYLKWVRKNRNHSYGKVQSLPSHFEIEKNHQKNATRDAEMAV